MNFLNLTKDRRNRFSEADVDRMEEFKNRIVELVDEVFGKEDKEIQILTLLATPKGTAALSLGCEACLASISQQYGVMAINAGIGHSATVHGLPEPLADNDDSTKVH